MVPMMTREHAGPVEAAGHRTDQMSSTLRRHDGRCRRSTASDPESSTASDPKRTTDSDPEGTVQPYRRTARARRGTSGLGTAIRRFGRGEHGGAAIESAIAIAILVAGFAGLMEVVQASYTDDRMSRAARAAARALALDPSADACGAIRRELGLAGDFDCGATWSLKVDCGVSASALPAPGTLPATFDASCTPGTGDMVLIRMAPKGAASSTAPVPVEAIGVARCELDLCPLPSS